MSNPPDPDTHFKYMQLALDLARKAPPKPSNYEVGAILVDPKTNTIIGTGFTSECEGNTHAEQSCLQKLAEKYQIPEESLGNVLPEDTVLYSTVEPCYKRLSGNLPCVDRILRLRDTIKIVYVGVLEPEKFVGVNTGRKQLEDAGIKVVLVPGLEKEILEVATAGHVQEK
jgi:pyrimidine deaminase RibD-like protein